MRDQRFYDWPRGTQSLRLTSIEADVQPIALLYVQHHGIETPYPCHMGLIVDTRVLVQRCPVLATAKEGLRLYLDDGAPVPFWIDKNQPWNNETSVFWVSLPYLYNGMALHIGWKNDGILVSSCSDCFNELGDDFTGTSISPIWNQAGRALGFSPTTTYQYANGYHRLLASRNQYSTIYFKNALPDPPFEVIWFDAEFTDGGRGSVGGIFTRDFLFTSFNFNLGLGSPNAWGMTFLTDSYFSRDVNIYVRTPTENYLYVGTSPDPVISSHWNYNHNQNVILRWVYDRHTCKQYSIRKNDADTPTDNILSRFRDGSWTYSAIADVQSLTTPNRFQIYVGMWNYTNTSRAHPSYCFVRKPPISGELTICTAIG